MAFPSEEELCDRIKHFERSLLNVMTQGTEADLTTLSRELQDLTEIISKATLEDNPPYTADLFACSKELANRVILVASYMQRIAHLADAAEKNLETKLTTVFNSSTRPSSQRSNLKGATSHSNDEFAALRRWFLEHIDNPYPDRSQKSQLQHELGLSLQSITQFFTNARRRSGWMDFVKKYRDGSVEDTAVLIRAIENQEGTDGTSAIDIPSGACDALTKIREYLSAGLEPEIRDGLEEALNMELKRIAEDKAKLLEQGAVLSDGLLPKRKKAKTTTTLDKPGTTMAPATGAYWPGIHSTTTLSHTQTSSPEVLIFNQTSDWSSIPTLDECDRSLTLSRAPDPPDPDMSDLSDVQKDVPSMNLPAPSQRRAMSEPAIATNNTTTRKRSRAEFESSVGTESVALSWGHLPYAVRPLLPPPRPVASSVITELSESESTPIDVLPVGIMESFLPAPIQVTELPEQSLQTVDARPSSPAPTERSALLGVSRGTQASTASVEVPPIGTTSSFLPVGIPIQAVLEQCLQTINSSPILSEQTASRSASQATQTTSARAPAPIESAPSTTGPINNKHSGFEVPTSAFLFSHSPTPTPTHSAAPEDTAVKVLPSRFHTLQSEENVSTLTSRMEPSCSHGDIPPSEGMSGHANGLPVSSNGGPTSISMPKPRNWNQIPRLRNAPSEVSRPTWSLQPAVSSTPKKKRRSPRKRAVDGPLGRV